MRRTLPLALLLAAAGLARAGDDEEILPCDSADGWQTALPGGGAPAGAELRADAGQLVLSYGRAKLAPLANYALLTDLRELRLRVRSTEAGTFAVVVVDRDGATWHQPFALPAATWTDVALPAAKFLLNADSAVKKPRFEPARLGAGWLLLDGAAIRGGGTGRNELRLDEVRIVREAPEETSGEWVIDAEATVARSRRHAGDIRVAAGGKLAVSAARFVLNGNLVLDGGAAEFRGGVVEIPQRFQHDREIRLAGGARLAAREALVVTRFPATLKLAGEQAVELEGVECLGGFTCDVPPKARIVLKRTKNPGEFVVAPGGTVAVTDCENVVLWHALGANLKGVLRFPAADVGDRWSSGHGLGITVERSRGVRWTLLSYPGAAGSVEDCEPTAAGLVFGGKTSLEIADLANGRALDSWKVPAPDRELAFRRAKVAAWNIYAADEAAVRLKKSTIGEAMTFGKGRIELEDSTVDGTGGYVGAHDGGAIRLLRCRVTCLVIARARSTVELVDCEVTGDVRAVGEGRVKLVRTAVSGRVEADAGAAIERE